MVLKFLLELIAIIYLLSSHSTGAPSISLSISVDVTSGTAVCSNIPPVEVSCIALEVSFLDWQVNGENIQPTFNIGDNPVTVNSGPYRLSLDRISADSVRPVANMTIRLVANISSLPSGYRITCLELVAENSVTLHYLLRGNPPALTDYTITIVKSNITTVVFNFTSDPKFNSDYGISSYALVPSPVQGHSPVECPRFCSPIESCQCTGRSTEEYHYISVSPFNCGNQEGPATLITVATACSYQELQIPGNLEVDCFCRSTVLREKVNLTIQNGFIEYTETSIGAVATYQCKEGYLLVGNPQRICQSNGHWNGSIPECQLTQNNSSSCYLTTVTGIVIGVVSFIFGFAFGVLLIFLIRCVYLRLYQKSSPHPVHAQNLASRPLDQSLEYQDVHLKPATCSTSTSTIPVTRNTAYGRGGKALGLGGQHKEIELEKNAAYGPN